MVPVGRKGSAGWLFSVVGAGLMVVGLVSLLDGGPGLRRAGWAGETQLLQLSFTAAGTAAAPAVGSIHKGELLSIDVPASQLAQSRIGDVVKGKLAAPGGGEFEFSGSIASGTELSPTLGAVTVRVISDTYIAPGTEVSGRVGNKMFTGTVTGSPADKERLANMEKRLAVLEQPAKKQVEDLKTDLKKMQDRLRRLEGGKTIKERIGEIEDRIDHLEHKSPALDISLIKDNAEGFHFHGSVGPNTLMPHLEDIEKGISKIEQEPGPEAAVEPVVNRLADMEDNMGKMSSVTAARRQIRVLEKRLVAIEKRAASS